MASETTAAAATTSSAVRERLVYGFNTFYGDLLSSVSKADETLKKRLKKCYRVLDRKSDAYLLDFYKSATESAALSKLFDDDCLGSDSVNDLQVARGMRLKELPASEFPTVRLLAAFAWLFGELCSAAEITAEGEKEGAVVAVNELFERLVESVSRIQGGLSWGAALDGMVDDEARAVFRSTLSKLAEASGAVAKGGATASSALSDKEVDDMTSAFDMMNCSKLGSIVQEISNGIDKEQLRKAVESGDLMGEKNMNMMGKLFRQVSAAITGKLQSGEISQEDLLKETSTLMSSMKGVL